MFRVLSAPIIRSTIKTADAIIGTVHVSVWFKSVESCPRSGVYFTMSWPSVILIACPQQRLLYERDQMLSYMYCACLVYFHLSQIVYIDSESTT
jgi:hypothetical protein